MNKQRAFLIAFFCAVGILVWSSQFGLAQEGQPDNPVSQPQASSSPFTYQGQIAKNNQPFDDTCRMAFRLYDAASGGNQAGDPLTLTVPVTAGLFTVGLDFGNASFDGSPRYLETQVQCSGEISYTNMGRHALTAAPYAANADLLDGQHASDFASSVALAALDSRVTILEGKLTDADGDLFYAGAQDCNDANSAIHLGAIEICTDTLDNDCDMLIDCADSTCSPDADHDGVNPSPCGGDCDDSNSEIYPGHSDYPDTHGLDENCDGIDGEESNAIFVSTTGDDSYTGSRLHPKFSIQAGIMTAAAQGKRDVYVASGVYTGQVSLMSGVGVYGGYSLDFADRDSTSNEVSILPPHPLGSDPGTVNCLHISGGVVGSSVLDGFSIFGDAQPAAGHSSYALYIHDCDATVKIAHNRILGGRGGNGAVGASGANGQTGTNGSAGNNAFDLPDHTCTIANTSPGGSGGVLSCSGINTSGGDGANRVCPTYSGGQTGYPTSGFSGHNSGGAAGISGRDYYQNPSCLAVIFSEPTATSGSPGSNGSGGSAGAGCSLPAGTVVGGVWLPNGASAGNPGTHGGGGGGGGSGAGAYVDSGCVGYSGDNLGGTGGGGGAGGCGGLGGQAGGSGGGAFGVFVYFETIPASIPALQDNQILGGMAGSGGAGGAGGAFGYGGAGGAGGTTSGAGVLWPSEAGGSGGRGGNGGYGGGGGGGCGGIAYAIYAVGQGAVDLANWKTQNLLLAGTPGDKGPGGTSPNNPGVGGVDGLAGDTNF